MSAIPRFVITTRDGRRFVGVVQGAGGPVTDLRVLHTMVGRACIGRPLGRIYEPEPGHCKLMPEFGAEGDGPAVLVPLAGARVEVVS